MLLKKKSAIHDHLDYAAFTGPPIGTGVEVVEADSLLTADREATDSYSREHVCPYLYNNPDTFSIRHFNAPDQFCAPQSRVTIDTPDDYDRVCSIVASLYNGTPIPAQRLVSFLKTSDYNDTSTDGII